MPCSRKRAQTRSPSPMTAEVLAPAKLNLTLHVTGQRPDGYHLLDSLVVFARFGDTVTVQPSDELRLTVTGPMSDGVPVDDSNLVMRAARLFHNPTTGADITLEKRLPSAAGIGGGSSDAAATLQALSRIWQCDIPGIERQLSLGADVPACVHGQTLRMSGVGEVISTLPPLPDIWVVMVNDGTPLATPDVFARLGNKANAPMPGILPEMSDATDCAAWLATMRNDLEAPAISLAPGIAHVLDAIRATGAMLARMSGSGATCFGLYPSESAAQNGARIIAGQHPDWWVEAAQLMR